MKQLRVNERITAREIRLVGDKGEQLGVMSIGQAIDAAKKSNLDLVEVASSAVPPVCRLLDYGKYKYEQTKKEHEAKKSQKVTVLRQVRIRPKIGDHDFLAKAKTARKLLQQDGAKVRINIMFRGREITHPELGFKLLKRMAEILGDVASLERQPMMEGRQMNIILAPMAEKPKVKETEKETENAEAKNP
ncbi:translation initiation factor IF-3 [Chloroflexota bacterium]